MKLYKGLSQIKGPLAFISGVDDVSFNEQVIVTAADGEKRMGQVLEISGDTAVIQVFEGTSGLDVENSTVRFLGEPVMIPVSEQLIGRILSGTGAPRDGGPEIWADEKRDINGLPINPLHREYPREPLMTGISSIDALDTLIRGQKLPIFSGAGLPHNEIAAQLVRQTTIQGHESDFLIIFAGMGIKRDVAEYFINDFTKSGVLSRVVMFLNLADEPPIERLLTPRAALTAAEYFAFDKGYHTLVVMLDMTNYAEALREISMSREEVPSRKGFPGYLYSDFATLYERTGRIKGKKGSITQIPILSMPNDDITHPIPDLTGYITEGQIVLSRELFKRNIYPPIDALPSLSRLMKDGIGEGYTRKDHPHLFSQLYASYSHVQTTRALASIIGEEELSEIDKKYMKFGEEFENRFLKQGEYERRSFDETLDLGWDILSLLPKSELIRVSEDEIKEFYKEREQ